MKKRWLDQIPWRYQRYAYSNHPDERGFVVKKGDAHTVYVRFVGGGGRCGPVHRKRVGLVKMGCGTETGGRFILLSRSPSLSPNRATNCFATQGDVLLDEREQVFSHPRRDFTGWMIGGWENWMDREVCSQCRTRKMSERGTGVVDRYKKPDDYLTSDVDRELGTAPWRSELSTML